jgi:hypothetical protein
MKQVRTWSVWSVAVAAVLAWNAAALSQTPTPTPPTTPGTPGLDQYASDNVSGGALRARSPGNMVGAGIARRQEAANFARGGVEIVETTRPMSARATFLVEAIEILFDQLNSTLLYLGNILLERAGLPPLVPPVPTPTTPDTTDTTDTTDSGATDGTDAGT